MLTSPDEIPVPGTEQAERLKVCTVSDDAAAVLHLADCLVGMPAHERIDLTLKDAVPAFEDAGGLGERFDLVLVALESGADMLPKQAQQLLDSAAPVSGRIVLLLDDRAARKMTLPKNAIRANPDKSHLLPDLLADELAKLRTGGDTGESQAGDAADTPGRSPLLGRVLRLFGRTDEAVERGGGGRVLTDALARRSATIVVQGLAGGVGTTTLAVNLAAELARCRASDSICLLDLNLQFGNTGDYLGLQENPLIEDAYRNFGTLDMDSFGECLLPHGKNLRLFSGAAQILPYDAITGKEAAKLVSLARQSAPVVIVDMPHALADWSGDVYGAADAVLCVAQQDVRCVRNAQKLRNLLAENGVGMEHFTFALNRAPDRKTPDWWETFASFETGLGAKISHFFPDGGDEVREACDLGATLMSAHAKNGLRQAIKEIAASTTAATYKAASHV